MDLGFRVEGFRGLSGVTRVPYRQVNVPIVWGHITFEVHWLL